MINQGIKIADWLCRNQVKNDFCPKSVPDACGDMNFGRFTYTYDTTENSRIFLSTSWLNGMTIYALLLMYDFVGDKKYLQAAIDASWYLKCLQIDFDPESPHYGAIREEVPSRLWGHPRDALSGAWGFLRLFRATKEPEYIKRAEIFAKWHSKHAMRDGYPIWTTYFDGRENDVRFGNFQAGSANFYFDLYQLTNNMKYREIMLGIMDFYIDNFFSHEEGMYICYDDKTGYRGDVPDAPDWCDMHKYNDDFNCIAVMNTYNLTSDEKYLEYIKTYLNWIITKQHENGGFGIHKLSVSSCVAALNLMNGFLLTEKVEYLKAAEKAIGHLQSKIITSEDSRLDGGVLGLNHCTAAPDDDIICLRVTMYSIYTLILRQIIDNKQQKIPDSLRQNPLFPGLRLG